VREVKLKYATLRVHHTKVQIYDGICDSADLCGIKSCRFYDTSREATRRFMRAQAEEHTLEHLCKRLNPH
jgi:hypothetical protein